MSSVEKPDQTPRPRFRFVKRLEDGRLLWWSGHDPEHRPLVWDGSAWVFDGRLTVADIDDAEFLSDEEVAALIRDGILPA